MNNWIFHHPKGNTLIIAPPKTIGKQDWNWGKATVLNKNGNMTVPGSGAFRNNITSSGSYVANRNIIGEINVIKNNFKARFPAPTTVRFPGFGQIIGGGDYFHFTGPNGKGSRRVAYKGGSHGNWGGW